MKSLATIAVILVAASTLVAQQSPKVVTPKVETPAQAATQGPKGTVVTPAPLVLSKDSKIPGDSEVIALLGQLNADVDAYKSAQRDLNDQYKEVSRKLTEKFSPAWTEDQEKLQKAVAKVKAANNWGEDVIFSGQTKQWIKLTPEELAAMKKAIAEPQKSATPAETEKK